MSWQTETVESIRVAIGDLSASPTYSDARLERVAVSAAALVVIDVDFNTSYTVNITSQSISPDPTSLDPKDLAFIMLVALKSAVLIAKGEMKLGAASGGIIIKDGPSSVDTSNYYMALSGMYRQFLDDYEFLKLNYKYVRSVMNAQAVLSPSTVLYNVYGNLQVLGY